MARKANGKANGQTDTGKLIKLASLESYVGNVPTQAKDGSRNIQIAIIAPGVRGGMTDATTGKSIPHAGSARIDVIEGMIALADASSPAALISMLRQRAAENRTLRTSKWIKAATVKGTDGKPAAPAAPLATFDATGPKLD